MSHFRVIWGLHLTELFVWTLLFSSSSTIHTEAVETFLEEEEKVSDHLGISWHIKYLISN